MDTVLLGEAPKARGGHAFDPGRWTTDQLERAAGIPSGQLHRYFWLDNVLHRRQRTQSHGFDRFSRSHAVRQLDERWFKWHKVICVGERVSSAVESALELRRGSIPQNRFASLESGGRGGAWLLARIPHPSALRDHADSEGLVLPDEARQFLRRAAGLAQGSSRNPFGL